MQTYRENMKSFILTSNRQPKKKLRSEKVDHTDS